MAIFLADWFDFELPFDSPTGYYRPPASNVFIDLHLFIVNGAKIEYVY